MECSLIELFNLHETFTNVALYQAKLHPEVEPKIVANLGAEFADGAEEVIAADRAGTVCVGMTGTLGGAVTNSQNESRRSYSVCIALNKPEGVAIFVRDPRLCGMGLMDSEGEDVLWKDMVYEERTTTGLDFTYSQIKDLINLSDTLADSTKSGEIP